MKTISIRQPWASLIVAGVKAIENRSRPTRYRGRVLIHAGQTIDRDGMAVVNEAMSEVGSIPSVGDWPTGAIIGCATIVDCVTESEDEFFEGPFGYVLAGAVEFDRAIPARGQLGLYETPHITVEMAAAILRKRPVSIRAMLARWGVPKAGRDYWIDDGLLTRLEAVPPAGRPSKH